MKILKFLLILIFFFIFNFNYAEAVTEENLNSKKTQIPQYIKEYLDDFLILLEQKNKFRFYFDKNNFIIMFADFKRKIKKDDKTYTIVNNPIGIIVFKNIFSDEHDLLSLFHKIRKNFKNSMENIETVYLYGKDVSVSWSKEKNEIKNEQKCKCGCVIGIFSKDICYHENCPMKK